MSACKILIAMALLTVTNIGRAHGQPGKIPPFAMMQPDGKIFRAQDLPMGKPMIIIYFSPECDHCEKLMKDFISSEENFRKASVVMITHLAVDKVRKFVQSYALNKYPNVYVGTEGTWLFVKNYYKILEMPFIALHDKHGNLVKMYREEGALPDLVKQLNRLN